MNVFGQAITVTECFGPSGGPAGQLDMLIERQKVGVFSRRTLETGITAATALHRLTLIIQQSKVPELA